MQLVPIRRKYVYQRLERVDRASGRVYKHLDFDLPMPSVTAVLSATKDKAHLEAWANRVGKDEAERIKNESATIGTHMHSVVERLLLNRPLDVPRTWLQIKGYRMGYALLEHFFPHVDEIWGSEVSLYYPDKYAGTTDFVGVYRGKPAIVDYKQANKPKKRQWIDDYFHQLAAYAAAHDIIHGTKIEYGAVLVIPREGEPQEFTSTGKEFQDYKYAWMRRVDRFLNGSF